MAKLTAGIDLSLALVAEDHGQDVALQVAKRLVVFTRRQGGQSQFSPYLNALGDATSPVAKIQTHVMEHIAERFTVKRLADVAGMSAGNFARVFVQEAKVTPADSVERARIDAARNLLEGRDMVLKGVAHQCGFGRSDRIRIVLPNTWARPRPSIEPTFSPGGARKTWVGFSLDGSRAFRQRSESELYRRRCRYRPSPYGQSRRHSG